MKNFKFSGCWYCEYRGVRVHDYFNLMINNFPIFTFRRLDFGLHDPVLTECYILGILGFQYHWNHIVK